jgi:molybdate transport system ATP-binding protein
MLRVDLRHRAGGFSLAATFDAGTPGLTALFGPSGAGKSTLLQLVAGLARPLAGRIELDGACLFDAADGTCLRPEERGIGYVFQDLRLFPHLDVTANLDYGRSRARGRPAALARERALELLALGPLLQRRIAGLSGGERQRVALGRALLAHPRLLLLDEPLSALDADRRAELLPYFERLRAERNLSILLVTHQYEDVLRLADAVVLLDAGRVLATGTPLALATDPAVRSRLPAEAVGALVEGRVGRIDAARGLAEVPLGRAGSLRIPATGLAEGQSVRLQLLARDLIVATEEPRSLSVRNRLRATVVSIQQEPGDQCLVLLDAGGLPLLARITRDACEELTLGSGTEAWVLVKALSLIGHIF